MSKTKEEKVLINVIEQDCKDRTPSIVMGDRKYCYVREDLAIQAMQTYALQQAVEFAEWAYKRDWHFIEDKSYWYKEGHKPCVMSGSDLYKSYLQSINQNK